MARINLAHNICGDIFYELWFITHHTAPGFLAITCQRKSSLRKLDCVSNKYETIIQEKTRFL